MKLRSHQKIDLEFRISIFQKLKIVIGLKIYIKNILKNKYATHFKIEKRGRGEVRRGKPRGDGILLPYMKTEWQTLGDKR